MSFSGAGPYLTCFSIPVPSLVPGTKRFPRSAYCMNEDDGFCMFPFKSLNTPETTPSLISHGCDEVFKGNFSQRPPSPPVTTRGLPIGIGPGIEYLSFSV